MKILTQVSLIRLLNELLKEAVTEVDLLYLYSQVVIEFEKDYGELVYITPRQYNGFSIAFKRTYLSQISKFFEIYE